MRRNPNINGIFSLAHLPKNRTISIAPLLNAGNVHRWAVEMFVGNVQKDKYAVFEQLLENATAGSNGLLFLPYLNGERCPVHDTEAKGAFWGIGPNTEKSDLAKAVMEGICFSFKQIIDVLVDERDQGILTLIGGGSNSTSWCQILADIIGRPVRVPKNSEYTPALGAASSGFVNIGWAFDYNDFCERFLATADVRTYKPITQNYEVYKENYQRYLKLYPSLKPVYE